MQISGVSSSYTTMSYSQTSLTDEQKDALEEILAKYDPENMSGEDMESLKTELQEAGIRPTREVGQIMNEAGFGPPSGVQGAGGPPPGPPPDMADNDDDEENELLELINQVKTGEITQEEFLSTLEEYAQLGGIISPGQVVDETA